MSNFSKNAQSTETARRGVMLVVSSPSGAGKTTLCEGLLKDDPQLVMSVSVTTRAPREGERHAVDYYFVSKDEFAAMRDAGDLLEFASVFDNDYGTPRAHVEKVLGKGQDILFDVDWQGAAQISETCGGELCRVFILPPSGEALEQRLTGRGQDSAKIVAGRMAKAAGEISHWGEYDYIIINDDLEIASQQLKSILVAERCKRQRQLFLSDFVEDMLRKL